MFVIKNKYNIIVSILTVIIPMIFQLLYIRYVSYSIPKSIYGDFIILTTFILALSQIFLSLPMQAFSRFYNSSEKNSFINEFRSYLFFINIICIPMVYLFYLHYSDRFDFKIYIFIYIFFIVSNNFILNQQIFLLNLDRKKYLFLKIFEGSAKYLLPIVYYYIYETLESLLIGLLIGYVLSFSLIYVYLKNYKFKFTFNFNNQKKYFLYAYPMIFTSVSSWSITFGDRFFIDYFLNTSYVAIYSILSQFAGFSQIIGTIYAIYVTPIILKDFEKNGNNTFELLDKYLKIFVIILILLFFIFLLLPRNTYILFIEKNIILNDDYYILFIVLVLGSFLTVFQTALSLYFVLLKKLKIHAIFFTIAAIINIILNFYIKDYGLIIAGLSTLFAYIFLSLSIIFWIKLQKRILFESNHCSID